MKTATPEKIKRDRSTLDCLLDELAEECERFLRLHGKLKGKRNGKIKRGDILVEVNSSIVHLHAHTKGLPDLIYDEFDREDDD